VSCDCTKWKRVLLAGGWVVPTSIPTTKPPPQPTQSPACVAAAMIRASRAVTIPDPQPTSKAAGLGFSGVGSNFSASRSRLLAWTWGADIFAC